MDRQDRCNRQGVICDQRDPGDIGDSHPSRGAAGCGGNCEVLYESFVEYEPLYTQQGFAATTPGADQILDRMREGPVWLALSGVKVLGTVAAVLRGGSAYMRGMAVLPTSRGMGIGSRLLECVENWASSQGCSRVFLSTTPYLAAAIRLYESLGSGRPTRGRTIFLEHRYLPWRSTSFGKGDRRSFPATKGQLSTYL